MFIFKCSSVFFGILLGCSVLANSPESLGLNNSMLEMLQPLNLNKVKSKGESAPEFKSFEAAHLGGNCILLKIKMAEPVQSNASVVVYLDLDSNPKTGRQDKEHPGIDLMGMFSGGVMQKSIIGAKSTNAAGTIDRDTLWMLIDSPLLVKDNNTVQFKMHSLSEASGKRSVRLLPETCTVPVNSKAVPPELNPSVIKQNVAANSREYYYSNDLVMYLARADKGLNGADIKLSAPVKSGRVCPVPQFVTNLKTQEKGYIAYKAVPIELQEETGNAGAADIRFGFPLPQGAVFDLSHFQVCAPAGRQIAAQFSATSFWPDKSIKWVLIQFNTTLRGKEKTIYEVIFGTDVTPVKISSNLTMTTSGKTVTVNTGAVKVQLNNNLIDKVWYKDKLVGGFSADGIVLTDENGNRFTSGRSAPEMTIEESGPEYLTLRFEGRYMNESGASYMKYVARISFRNNSSVISLTLTHINDYLKTEFTDITSLTLPYIPANTFTNAAIALNAAPDKYIKDQQRAFQLDESTLSISNNSGKNQMTGAVTIDGNSKITLAWQNFWRRWPKAYKIANNAVMLEILPEQPGKDYGRNQPYYLMYPFCEGKYRFKWGMAFTERIKFDFSGEIPAKQLQADIDKPVIPVVPAAWYVESGAFPDATAPRGSQFTAWDAFINSFFKSHMALKMRQREFGYFNYGDWFGERGRNWGNNEYDLAHGLFAAFARTGNRDYCRLAVSAARHQADVDIVHAYPDPYYAGANHQHSIGHTGQWSQIDKRATWTHPYDSHTSAENGHTWSAGMLDAWMLTGDPVVMESALKLGEHIVWAMAPSFKKLSSHERTAGWSLKAILNFYRLNNDSCYLEAAKSIAEVALREQKANGAWPHQLPPDHAEGRKDVIGNNLFLIGILTSSLKDYYLATGDQKVRKALLEAVDWICKSYDRQKGGWSYSASQDGQHLGKVNVALNMLIIDSIAYAAIITGKKEYADIAAAALETTIMVGPGAIGKDFGEVMVFADSIIKNLNDFYSRKIPESAGKIISLESVSLRRGNIPDTEKFNVRGPDDKIFYLKLKKDNPEITLYRKKHGSRPNGWDSCSVAIFGHKGVEVYKYTYKPDAEFAIKTIIKGSAGKIFKVVFHDDMRGLCDVLGKDVQVMLNISRDTMLGAPIFARFYLTVPKGAGMLNISLCGVHTGTYGALLLIPDGGIGRFAEGINTGRTILPWSNGIADENSANTTLSVKIPDGQDGKVWPLIIWGAGDIGLQIDGIPPYLSRNKEAAFAIEQ